MWMQAGDRRTSHHQRCHRPAHGTLHPSCTRASLVLNPCIPPPERPRGRHCRWHRPKVAASVARGTPRRDRHAVPGGAAERSRLCIQLTGAKDQLRRVAGRWRPADGGTCAGIRTGWPAAQRASRRCLPGLLPAAVGDLGAGFHQCAGPCQGCVGEPPRSRAATA